MSVQTGYDSGKMPFNTAHIDTLIMLINHKLNSYMKKISQMAAVVALSAVVALPQAGFAAIERVNLSSGGAEANAYATTISISSNGQYVAFFSTASNLVAGDTNGVGDIFVRDRINNTVERVSVSTAGVQQNKSINTRVSISSDGRYVAFMSSANNLVAGDTNGKIDVFVRDRQTNTTERVSVSSAGVQGDKDDVDGATVVISADGRYVAFLSKATNLVAGDTNGYADVFVRDRQTNTTERVSVATGGTQGNLDARTGLAISSDGRYVAFNSRSSNLVAGDTNSGTPNGGNDTFVRDRQLGTTERVSIADDESQSNGDNITGYNVTISADGRYVTFASDGTNLVAGDTNSATDIFLRDRTNGTTEIVSLADDESIGNAAIQYGVAISANGQFVAFSSNATNLVAGDTNGKIDVFVRDRTNASTRRVVAYDSSEANDSVQIGNLALSPEGNYLGFLSPATNLVAGDTNAVADAFLEY